MESGGRGQLRCGEAGKPTSSKGVTTFRRRSVSGKARVRAWPRARINHSSEFATDTFSRIGYRLGFHLGSIVLYLHR